MFDANKNKTFFIIIIIMLAIGMVLPFFTKLWN